MLHFTPSDKPSKGVLSHVYKRGDVGIRVLFDQIVCKDCKADHKDRSDNKLF